MCTGVKVMTLTDTDQSQEVKVVSEQALPQPAS
jgi:hypothetical protein